MAKWGKMRQQSERERKGGRGEEKGEGMEEEGREEQLSGIPFSLSILICTDLWEPPVLAIGISIFMHFPIQDTMRFPSISSANSIPSALVSSVVKLKKTVQGQGTSAE